MATVAVVEDDAHILAAVTRGLTERGHVVLGAASGLGALGDIVEQRPDVVVLDLGLPDIDGLELLRMLRAVSTVPVIVATARDEEAEIIRSLDAGADGYVVKPYSAQQLDARIRAVLRRVREDDGEEPIRVGGSSTWRWASPALGWSSGRRGGWWPVPEARALWSGGAGS